MEPIDTSTSSQPSLERQLARARSDMRTLAQQNERLAKTLNQARAQMVDMKERLDALGQPPLTFGIVLERPERKPTDMVASADVFVQGRRMRLKISAQTEDADIHPGCEVMVNETLVIVGVRPRPLAGDIVTVDDILDPPSEDGLLRRAVVTGAVDTQQVVVLAPSIDAKVRAGDRLLIDKKAQLAFDMVPKVDVEDLVLEDVPDIDWNDIGGLSQQIEEIRDAVELPFGHPELFTEYDLKPPKGVLLYGPPGCGKTMIAKAVANSLAHARGQDGRSWFYNVKGPELLNKYVGESERQIRHIFERARAKAGDGRPVIVFFDEMDSLFRTRGSGVSSDVENTIVPQLLSELDGVEDLSNVIIIGASNREDMIDPAILRPGRLDVKIRVERPDAEAALEIFGHYLTPQVRLHADDLREFSGDAEACRRAMIDRVVTTMYAPTPENEFLELTFTSGRVEVLHFRDLASGAMIRNIVDRAKKRAVKEHIDGGGGGVRMEHLLGALTAEFAENEDLPNTTSPDDWARIAGALPKGERITQVRPLLRSKHPTAAEVSTAETGQYL